MSTLTFTHILLEVVEVEVVPPNPNREHSRRRDHPAVLSPLADKEINFHHRVNMPAAIRAWMLGVVPAAAADVRFESIQYNLG